jgi:hypothetical protein
MRRRVGTTYGGRRRRGTSFNRGATNTIIDGFEDGDLSEYTDSDVSVVTTRSYNGQYALQFTVGGTSGFQEFGDALSDEGDGLNYYPDRGDEIVVWHWMDPQSTQCSWFDFFGKPDQSKDGYRATGTLFANNPDELAFEVDRIGSASTTNITYPRKEWFRVRIDWADPTITVIVEDQQGSELGRVSADDTTYDAGGVGWQLGGTDGVEAYTDYAFSR